MLFFVWLVIMIVMLADVGNSRKFFWLALPGVVTYFVIGMNLLDVKDKGSYHK